MTIVFAGHFTIGEKTNNTQLKTIAEAKKVGGDFAILVNDIDIKRKLQFFRIGGKEMVIRHYVSRRKCGTAAPLCALPEYTKLPDIIDWDFYEAASAKIKKSKTNICEILRKKIIPEAIQKRLIEYRLPQKSVKIFTERELRNFASERLRGSRQNGKKSWIPLLKKVDILKDVQANISKIPLCGAIMLALYEKVSKAGYESIIEFCAKEDKNAIENGRKLCAKLHRKFPKDVRWKLNMKFKYF